MIEELQHVDDSILTSLIELRHERDALRQRLARMQESASKVSEPVLARVRGDYEARIAALDAKASPLKDAARGAFGRLKPLLDEAQGVCETLRLDQEEVELRHSLGEFDDDVHRFAGRGLFGHDPDGVVERREGALELDVHHGTNHLNDLADVLRVHKLVSLLGWA